MARILVANKFYYPRGGDCIYTIDLVGLLQSHGHDVAVFAMQHPETLQTPWNKYFPEEVKFGMGVSSFKAVMRPFGTADVIQKFNALLDDFKPDIVHLNNIHSQLSPVIAELAHSRGIKVFWTLHDYKLLCPRYDCLQNGTICERCLDNLHNVVKYKCLKHSYIASSIAYLEARKWNRDRLEKCTDQFIAPSQFMLGKMKSGGFSSSKITQLYHFVDKKKYVNVDYNKEDYYCYVGRLSSEKGVTTLIEAANQLPYKLKIVGDGPLKDELAAKVNKDASIDFLGFKSWEEVKTIVSKARFIVVPSEWYEVLGLVIIEAECVGTPILGARIGAIPELIEENVNGMYFESRNVSDLSGKITEMFNASFDYQAIAERAQKKLSAETYYEHLIKVYDL